MSAAVPGLAARRSISRHAARISSFHGMSGLRLVMEVRRFLAYATHRGHRLVLGHCAALPDLLRNESATNAAVRDGCVGANNAEVASEPGANGQNCFRGSQERQAPR